MVNKKDFKGYICEITGKRINEMMKLRNVVNTRNHGYVAIDTCYTFDHGFETMVFKCDKNGNIIDWSDLDVDMYDNAEKAEEGHKEMIEKWKNK